MGRAQEIEKYQKEIFNLANSFSGGISGKTGVELHVAANALSRASESIRALTSTVYIAASYPRKEEAKLIAETMLKIGYGVTSNWLLHEEGYEDKEEKDMDQKFYSAAQRDLRDVKEANLFICITDGKTQLTHGGRHTEFGIALAMNKRIILIGPRESVFHYHPLVSYFNGTTKEACAYLETIL